MKYGLIALGSLVVFSSFALVCVKLIADENAKHKKIPQAQLLTAKESEDETSEVRQGPALLDAQEAGIGKKLPNLKFTDIHGKAYALSDFRDKKATVIALVGTGCPLCLKYGPTLAKIEKEYLDKDVAFIFVNPNQSESHKRLTDSIKNLGYQSPYVQDGKRKIPFRLGAKTTTEAFLLDANRNLVYRGAVNDQYGFGYALQSAGKSYLRDAIDAVLSGAKPKVQATSSPGCHLFYDEMIDETTDAKVTYHNQIARLIQKNCIECHRDGGISPIPFETYEDVKDYAGMIKSVVDRQVMPPWFAGTIPKELRLSHAKPYWANDRSLSDEEKQHINDWIEAGLPEGRIVDSPKSKSFPDGWLIGKPDLVVGFDKPIAVKADGVMPYQYATIDTKLEEDTWIQAIEVRPGQIDVVHHVIVSIMGENGRGGRDEERGFWGVYVPGNSTLIYPEGYAKKLPRGAKLRFQMHYTPNGTATEDTTRVGMVFAKQPPKHEIKVAGVVNRRINIPANAANHKEVASIKVPYDVEVLAFLPHMHLRGKAARYEAITSEGTKTLLDVPRYDFNWQLLYRLNEPIRLERGDQIRFSAWFDNSKANPANPNPNVNVKWGEQTFNEMHLGYVEFVEATDEPVPDAAGQMKRAVIRGTVKTSVISALFQQLDKDRSGKVSRDEVKARFADKPAAYGEVFDKLDQDDDDLLSKEELLRLNEVIRK